MKLNILTLYVFIFKGLLEAGAKKDPEKGL